MCGCVRCSGNGTVGLAVADKQIAEIERIFHRLFGLFQRDAFCTAEFVIERCRFGEICRFAMVEYLYAVQVYAFICGGLFYLFFVADDRYFGYLFANADFGGASVRVSSPSGKTMCCRSAAAFYGYFAGSFLNGLSRFLIMNIPEFTIQPYGKELAQRFDSC